MPPGLEPGGDDDIDPRLLSADASSGVVAVPIVAMLPRTAFIQESPQGGTP